MRLALAFALGWFAAAAFPRRAEARPCCALCHLDREFHRDLRREVRSLPR